MSALEYFGKILIEEVRDRTIRIFDKRLNGDYKTEDSQQLHKEMQTFSDSQCAIINAVVAQVTDLCLHNIMCLVEEHNEIELLLDGCKLKEISDGLAGELYSDDGWIKKYSKQRIV